MEFTRIFSILSVVLFATSSVRSAPTICGANDLVISPEEQSCLLGHLVEIVTHLVRNQITPVKLKCFEKDSPCCNGLPQIDFPYGTRPHDLSPPCGCHEDIVEVQVIEPVHREYIEEIVPREDKIIVTTSPEKPIIVFEKKEVVPEILPVDDVIVDEPVELLDAIIVDEPLIVDDTQGIFPPGELLPVEEVIKDTIATDLVIPEPEVGPAPGHHFPGEGQIVPDVQLLELPEGPLVIDDGITDVPTYPLPEGLFVIENAPLGQDLYIIGETPIFLDEPIPEPIIVGNDEMILDGLVPDPIAVGEDEMTVDGPMPEPIDVTNDEILLEEPIPEYPGDEELVTNLPVPKHAIVIEDHHFAGPSVDLAIPEPIYRDLVVQQDEELLIEQPEHAPERYILPIEEIPRPIEEIIEIPTHHRHIEEVIEVPTHVEEIVQPVECAPPQALFIPVIKFDGLPCLSGCELREFVYNILRNPTHCYRHARSLPHRA